MAVFTPTGTLEPVRGGKDSTTIALTFKDYENTPENIMRQKESTQITREVQTKENYLAGLTKTMDLGRATIKWQYFTQKREFRAISENIAKFQPLPQKFQKWGATASKYGDEHLVTHYLKNKSVINIPKVVMVEMEAAFVRLQIRQAFAAMLNPVRWQYQQQYNEFKTDTGMLPLPNIRTGVLAVVVNHTVRDLSAPTAAERKGAGKFAVEPIAKGNDAGGQAVTIWYAKPSNRIFSKLKRVFTNYNISASEMPCMPVTPNFQEQLEEVDEYENRFKIWYARKSDSVADSFVFRDIKFVRTTPECMPGAYFAGKNVRVAANLHIDPVVNATDPVPQPVILPLTDMAAGNGVLGPITSSNNEALPLWYGDNVSIIRNKALDRFKVTKIPLFREEEMLWVEKWIGGAREENFKQFVLVVPYIE